MALFNQLRTLENSGLIRLAQAQPDLEYLFRHALMQDAAYRSLVKQDRKQLHLAVGEALERMYADRVDDMAALLARHFDEAGDDERALKYFTLAGDRAARRYANAEAVMHYACALEIARRAPADADRIRHLYMGRGRSLELISQFDLALRSYKEMEALARQRGDRNMELAGLVSRATIRVTPNLAHDPEEGQALLEQAHALARDLADRAAEAKILWNLMLLNTMRGGDVHERIAYGEQALALARALDQREQMAFILNDLWFAYTGASQWARSLAALEEARELWRELGNLTALAENLGRTYLTHLVAGDYNRAVACFEEALRLARAIGSVDMQALCRFMIGFVYLERGEFGPAIAIMEEAIALAESVGNVSVLIGTRADLGWAYGLLGAVDKGLELVRLAQMAAEEKFLMMHQWPLAIRVTLNLLQGDLAAAGAGQTALGSHRDLKRQLGYMPFLWTRVALAVGEYAFATQDYPGAVATMDDLIVDLRAAGLRFLLPDALALKGKSLMADGRAEAALETLQAARAEAEGLGSRRSQWSILMALSGIEMERGHPVEAEALRQQARTTVEYITEHAGSPELRASFLNLAGFRDVMRD